MVSTRPQWVEASCIRDPAITGGVPFLHRCASNATSYIYFSNFIRVMPREYQFLEHVVSDGDLKLDNSKVSVVYTLGRTIRLDIHCHLVTCDSSAGCAGNRLKYL